MQMIENGVTSILMNGNKIPLQVFGDHNLQNINGARLVCNQLDISDEQFYEAIQDFKGASKRLELIARNESTAVYKDFAHSPSKLKATTNAVKQQYKERNVIACMELHTFSSLNEEFLKQYTGCMDKPDTAIVYFSPEAIAHKKLEPISKEQVHTAFGRENLLVFTNSIELEEYLKSLNWNNKNLLMMSSGTFDGIEFGELII